MSDSERPRVLITGAASGLGLETARGLAQRGWDVALADRNIAAGQRECNSLRDRFVQQHIEFVPLDLASLSAIHDFSIRWGQQKKPLDCLINNAGIFPPHQLQKTEDGFELAFGIGVYGHYALTGKLLPWLLKASNPRVVFVSSIAHEGAVIDLENPKQDQGFDSLRAYQATKLGNLLLALELNRLSVANGSSLRAMAAHPGISRTALGTQEQKNPRTLRQRSINWAQAFAMRFLGQSATDGAKPLIMAAVDPSLSGGELIGPDGYRQFRGEPTVVNWHQKTVARHDATALWNLAQQQTGVEYQWQSR